jgi:cytochrome P450
MVFLTTKGLNAIVMSIAVCGVALLLLIHVLLGPPSPSAPRLTGLWAREEYADYYFEIWPSSKRFDHPEPNFVYLHYVAEFWSCLTTIPFAGIVLLYIGVSQNYDVSLIYLYVHTVAMYLGAFVSHMTLIAPIFSWTVSMVLANSLYAYFWWGHLLGGWFNTHSRLLAWVPASVGLVVAVSAILLIQELESLQPVGGFYTLVIVQPPFVFLGMCSALYLRTKNPTDEGFRLLALGAMLLMTAMGVSAVETFVDPLLVGTVPVLHIVIHILEQIGIYLYGTGTATVHFCRVCGRADTRLVYHGPFPVLLTEQALPHSSTQCLSSSHGFDLLDPGPRQNPHAFNQAFNATFPTRLCPVMHEQHVFALSQPELLRAVLNDADGFSSNPFPDQRLVGMSTASGERHKAQKKLVARFFSKPHLKRREAEFARVIDWVTRRFVVERKGGELVHEWAYRIAVASGLLAMGIPVEELEDDRTLDEIARYSVDVVRLVAPLGGMGPRAGATLPQLLGLGAGLLRAMWPTVQLIGKVGVSAAWSLLRPDLQLCALCAPSAGTPRTGLTTHGHLLPRIPVYLLRLLELWERCAAKQPECMLGELLQAKQQGKLSVAEALLVIVQCLVSMTTANALVHTLLRVLHDPVTRASLQRDPSSIPVFADLALRVDAPLQRLPRRVVHATELAGTPLPAGSTLMLMLGAANEATAPSAVDCVDTTDAPAVARSKTDTYTFGWGMHRCLGEELVRLELRLAMDAWLRHNPDADGVALLKEGARLHNVDVGNYGFERVDVRLR